LFRGKDAYIFINANLPSQSTFLLSQTEEDWVEACWNQIWVSKAFNMKDLKKFSLTHDLQCLLSTTSV
jgi:hypothetical protein